MNTFSERLEFALKFEEIFIEEFNHHFQEKYQIIKFGIESTKLIEIHKILRYCHDKVSHFVRYIPDSVLVEMIDKEKIRHRQCKNFLVEFKVGLTGVKKESFFNEIKEECPEVIFINKDDVLNIEKDAIDIYLDLEKKIKIPVILVIYALYHKKETLYAQFASRIQICNEYNPNIRKKGTGSGTILYNISLHSLSTLTEFIVFQLGISADKVENFVRELKNKLQYFFSTTE